MQAPGGLAIPGAPPPPPWYHGSMPHKDPETRQQYMRQYQLTWMWRRRWTWILENGPCRWCGSANNLSVSFRNPATKTMKVAAIWSRNDEKRAEILADCEVLCIDCHNRKIAIWRAVKSVMSKEKAPGQ